MLRAFSGVRSSPNYVLSVGVSVLCGAVLAACAVCKNMTDASVTRGLRRSKAVNFARGRLTKPVYKTRTIIKSMNLSTGAISFVCQKDICRSKIQPHRRPVGEVGGAAQNRPYKLVASTAPSQKVVPSHATDDVEAARRTPSLQDIAL